MSRSVWSFLSAMLLVVASGTINAQEANKAEGQSAAQGQQTLEQKVCYLIGYNMGQQLKAQNIDVDLEQMMLGLRTALEGKDLGMPPAEAQKIMMEFAQKLEAREAKELEELAMKNMAEGEAFLKSNAAKEGVQTLDSGLQIRVIAKGDSSGKPPTNESFVRVHYTGKLIDGTVFDSSIGGEPVQFPVAGVIRGMTEGLKTMRVGDKVELVIPSNLAYGVEGRMPRIGPNSVLIFEVELVEVSDKRDN